MEERIRASLSVARLGQIAQLGCPQLDAERFYAGLAGCDFHAALLELAGLLSLFPLWLVGLCSTGLAEKRQP